MATISGLPAGIEAPDLMFTDGRYDHDASNQAEQVCIETCQTWLRENGYTSPYAGKIIRFPIADGYAQYMIASLRPASLIHLPLGDAWQIPEPHARGLRAVDLREHADRADRLTALFGRD